ncbi:MAG: hypothetical protein HGA87_05350, partial [Desulfobulbaceae bacterium]|nr:hypothetical protein [Desulfobulbaceae bacterium]
MTITNGISFHSKPSGAIPLSGSAALHLKSVSFDTDSSSAPWPSAHPMRPGVTRGVEEDHGIIGQGVGVKPEAPEPSPHRPFRGLGEGGLADVQPGVELAVQPPAAFIADEHPAYPASA